MQAITGMLSLLFGPRMARAAYSASPTIREQFPNVVRVAAVTGTYVHRGFDADANKVYQDLLPHLNRDMELRMTGHSLGAAIATLLMMHRREDGFNVGPSINFGQPKITNIERVNKYHQLPLTRIVDANDSVPMVPPVTMIHADHGAYEHLGRAVVLLSGEFYAYLTQHGASRSSAQIPYRQREQYIQ